MIEYRVLTLRGQSSAGPAVVHPVVFFDGADVVLCDAGFPGQVEQIDAELKKHGLSVGGLTKIVITHHDHDHMGSLRALKETNPGIEIVADEREADFIEGAKTSLRLVQARALNASLTGADLGFGQWFCSYLETIQPCAVDRRLGPEDRSVIDGLEVVPTPGHMPGHVSLYLRDAALLVSGDALAAQDGRLMMANPKFTLDMAEAVRSVERLAAMRIDTVVCYHGGVVSGDIRRMLDVLLGMHGSA
ncbi:MAG: MBL fold metallo-hydrolase [Spirochaetae bacterium HGW-Spirochaetae-3]|jgi:glyoxylase-like metal-dependent hydrolase (beta-lactamase superfamily II)|nr:MAG: MBL fold metallo-hydrolase [Spirochaetae bacterium HGW-Spirochaetae-3]